MAGETSLPLSELLNVLGIIDSDVPAYLAKIDSVVFSNPKVLQVTYIEEPTTVGAIEDRIFDDVFLDGETEIRSSRELDAGDWLLTSLAPFRTEETLTVTMIDGQKIVIDVFDAQEVAGNKYITDAQLTIDGITYGKNDTWHVYPEVGYTMKLSFAEKGSNQFPQGGDTIVVDLPQGLTLAEDGHHTFTIPAGLAGTITGNEYWVENGFLYIKFGEDPEDILTRSSNAHLDLTFTAEFDEGTTQIPFNGNVKPNIDMENDTDVSVSKSASYNSATGQMDYTITVTSTGNSENVVVHDALANTNLLTIDTESITVSPGGTTYTVTSESKRGFDMSIPYIGHNQTVTITYSADVDTSVLNHNGTVKVSDDGKNTVTVGNHTAETHTHQIKYSNTSKASTSVQDHETTATLGWKIVLNDNYRGSIVGDTVTDTIDWSSKDVMKYTKNEDGTVTLTIVAKSQDETKPPYSTTINVSVTEINGQESWEYTIPQFSADDPDEILSYEITYTTEVDKTKFPANSDGIVKNNTTNEGDDSSTGTGVVNITPDDDIVGGKTATDVTAEYIDWDIVINVPQEGFPDGLTVTDYIPMAPQYGGFADTFDSVLSVTGLAGAETYDVDCVSTNLDENGAPIQGLIQNNRTRDVVTFKFYQDADKTQPGLTETDAARTVTIKIRTRNDPNWLAYVEEHEGASDDQFVYYHTNIAKVNNTTFEGKAAPQKSKIYKSLIPSTETAGDGTPVYLYAVDLAGVKRLPVVIEDTFNADELEYYGKYGYIAAASMQYQLNNGIYPFEADIVAEDGKITITATKLPRKEDGSFYEYYRIYYKLKIKSPEVLASFTEKALENHGTYIVRNTAVWNGTEDHVDIEFTVPVVEKKGAFRISEGESGNNRLYDFTIDINKDCRTLNGGEPMDLSDTHTPNLTVDYTTVKVFKYVNGVKEPDTSIGWNYNGNIGTFYGLQDKTHYTIEYSCLVIGSGNQEFSNYAEMNGFHGEKHDSRDFGSTIDTGADVFQIGLIKYQNGMTSNGLAGATFQLFRGTGKYTMVTEGGYSWGVEEKEPLTYGNTPYTRGEIHSDQYDFGTIGENQVGQNITFTTGSNGYVLIALNQSIHGAELEEGVHYYLKETESPPGYQIDSSVEYWEFTLTLDPDQVCYGTERDEYNNRKWVYFYYDDILKMNNTQTDEPITVNVDKEWFDIDGNRIENPEQTASVQLYQKTNDGPYVAVETITNTEDKIYNGEITLPVEGSWAYTWEKLPRVDTQGNAYAYKLEEAAVPEDYVSTSSLTETENEKSYHLKNYQVVARKVNVSVSKVWKDKDGNTITVDQLPADITDIRFNIYRVVSRVPFTSYPTSGGNPYVIQDSQYSVPGATEEEGLYSIRRDNFGAVVTFEDLPSVEKVTDTDRNDTWYFYSYYVKEIPVDGYASIVEVEARTDSSNNKILISSLTNKEKPEPMDLEVKKVWKNNTGGPASWPAGTVVQFELYRVSGREPFTEQPDSGGTLYNVPMPEGQTHPNKVADKNGLYQIGQNTVFPETAVFNDLPKVTYNASGIPTYYAYYIKEIAIEGYKEPVINRSETDDGWTITIENQEEPDYTQLAVQKKWYDGETELTGSALTNLEATVELVRYRAETGTMVHFYKWSDGKFVKIEGKDLLVPSNNTNVTITLSGIQGNANVLYGSNESALNTAIYANNIEGFDSLGHVGKYETNFTITTGNKSDVYVAFSAGIDFDSAEANPPATGSGAATIEPTFESSRYRKTLNSTNLFYDWYDKLLTSEKVGDKTYIYTYGIREVSNPSGFEFERYSVGTNTSDSTEGIKASNPGTGTIIVYNQKTQELYGSLSITKRVSNGNAIDKIFTFEVELKNPDNTAYTGTVKVLDRTRTTETTVTADNGKITVTVSGTSTATITEIPAGTKYEVTEPTGNLPGGWTQKGAITYNDSEKVIQAGDSDSVTVKNKYDASTSFTPKAKKIFTNGTITEGQFTFILTEVDSNTATAPKSGTVPEEKTVSSSDPVSFSTISYQLSDLGNESSKTFYYTITEKIPEAATEENAYIDPGTGINSTSLGSDDF